MKERPILFSGPMVRALLAGTKTQTRRVVKSPFLECLNAGLGANYDLCPYGQPGDLLWVRETHWVVSAFDDVRYRATEPEFPYGWTPSIHMPRKASRILLEITAVRVERLQDISDDDARAEGVAEYAKGLPDELTEEMTRQEGYRHLWESINGTESWDANPWVWVVEFKRVK